MTRMLAALAAVFFVAMALPAAAEETPKALLPEPDSWGEMDHSDRLVLARRLCQRGTIAAQNMGLGVEDYSHTSWEEFAQKLVNFCGVTPHKLALAFAVLDDGDAYAKDRRKKILRPRLKYPPPRLRRPPPPRYVGHGQPRRHGHPHHAGNHKGHRHGMGMGRKGPPRCSEGFRFNPEIGLCATPKMRATDEIKAQYDVPPEEARCVPGTKRTRVVDLPGGGKRKLWQTCRM